MYLRIVAIATLIILLTVSAACGSSTTGGLGGAPEPTATVASSTAPESATPTTEVGAAGGAETPSDAGTPSARGTSRPGGAPRKVVLAMGYIPSIQFAPFYVAAQKGYYRDEGLDVTFQHGIVSDLLKLVGTGKLDYAVASGDEMLVARSQGVPLVYAGAYFQKYPVTLITPKKAGLDSVQKLKGKTVGVPGPFGATYTGLKALLLSAGLTERDVTIRTIGFTQVQALQGGKVDAVMGYANNEPLQLERLGVPVNTIGVWETTNLVSNGVVTNESNLKAEREEVGALVRATMRGLEDSIADPEAALEAGLKYVPEAAATRELQLEVIRASIPLWQNEASKLNGSGYSDPEAWRSTLQFLRKSGAVTKDVDLEAAYTNEFVEKPAGR